MKARKKGTQEWKEYREVFGPDHEFLGLETLGYWQSDEDYCKEHGIPYDPESPFNNGGYYKSEVLPLECFDLWEEPDWSAFRREAAKEILAGMVANKVYRAHPDDNDEDELKAQQRAAKRAAFTAIVYADALIENLKQE